MAFAFVAMLGPGLLNGALASALTAHGRLMPAKAVVKFNTYVIVITLQAAEMMGINGIRLLWGIFFLYVYRLPLYV